MPFLNSPLRKRAALVSGLLLLGLAILLVHRYTRPTDAVSAMASGHYAAASEFYASAAQAGDPRAANSLANLQYLGLGVPQDLPQAAQWYFRAAGEAYAPAHLNLGHLYKQGMGVSKDPMRAFAWYRMADIHGNPQAEYYLRQISLEYTLTPLQMSHVNNRWARLDDLLAEGL